MRGVVEHIIFEGFVYLDTSHSLAVQLRIVLFSTWVFLVGNPTTFLERPLGRVFHFLVHYQEFGQDSSSNYNLDPIEGLVFLVRSSKWKLYLFRSRKIQCLFSVSVYFNLLEECIGSSELQIHTFASGQTLHQAYNAIYLPRLLYFASEKLQGVWQLFGGEIAGVKEPYTVVIHGLAK